MSVTSKVELNLDDFARVLGGIDRVREAHVTCCREQAFVMWHALGWDHPTTQAAFRKWDAARKHDAGGRS